MADVNALSKRKQRKQGRRAKQLQAMAEKAATEGKYFWEMKEKLASKKGGSKQETLSIEQLFGKKSGTVGINFKAYDKINVVRSGPNADERMGYKTPTPIQKHAVPLGLFGHDLMCCAQTGSGKTFAFLLPLSKAAITSPCMPRALILAPTRELAQQIELEAKKLTFKSNIQTAVVYGGAKAKPQLAALAYNKLYVLVATPGRLQDFVDRGLISLQKCKFLVLDEADRMLDMGFEPQIRKIVMQRGMMSSSMGRQSFLFSATFPVSIQKLASSFLHKNYVFVAVDKRAKLDMLLHELSKISGRTLVFVKKKSEARWLTKQLVKIIDLSAVAIHGDRSQNQRESALKQFRGLDIPNIEHVINFSLPDEFDSYVHRIGRTGRAGHNGVATTFYMPGMDKKSENGKLAKDILAALKESGSNIPSWFLSLPDCCGGPKKKLHQKQNVDRDIRPHVSRDVRRNSSSNNNNNNNKNKSNNNNNNNNIVNEKTMVHHHQN
eukprot:GSMAST32.ASY1.ANO1.549.1 assembled CDS